MRRALPFVVLLSLIPCSALADMDSIELRKSRHSKLKLGFAFIGLYEQSVGTNADRPDVTSWLYLAPQLKIGDKLRARINFGFMKYWLDRQDNPWDMMDIQLQLGHLRLYREKYTGIDFSGHLRYYIPVSKQSRNEGSYGQLRGTAKMARTFGKKFYASFEFNLQKYFHRYTTWSTDETQGATDWYRTADRSDYVDNNADYGMGETFLGTFSPIDGLDLSVIYGLMQTRQYEGGSASDRYGSSLVNGRMTRWVYGSRLYLDATACLSLLPWWKDSYAKQQILNRSYVSVGYANISPQLYNGHTHYTPFDPIFGYAYLDLMFMY
jgi:hypothetical protein